MDFMFYVWIGVIVVSAIIEFITLDMTSIWFTAGAIPSLIMSIVGGVRWEIQLAVFFVLSVVLILSLRKVTKNYLLRNAKEKTNLDAIVGSTYKMLSRGDDDQPGTIKVNGVIWNAAPKNGQTIEAGEQVKIVKVEGSKFIVEKIEKTEQVKKD